MPFIYISIIFVAIKAMGNLLNKLLIASMPLCQAQCLACIATLQKLKKLLYTQRFLFFDYKGDSCTRRMN